MELRQLEYFVAVAEEMSFSRGARRQNVVQSAVSTAVGKLERELGTPLFDRSKLRIELTPAGRAFLAEARSTLHAAQRAKDAVTGFHGRLSGTVDLGTLMSSGPVDVPAALGRFHAAYPLVSVRLRQGPAGSAGHVAAIAEGSLDLALVSLSGKPAMVSLRPLVEEPMVFLCRPDHALARRRQIRITDLADETFVHFVTGWGVRRQVDQVFRDAGVEPAAPYEVSDYATAAGLVRHRLGTTLVPRSAAAPYTELRALPLVPTVTWRLSLAVPDGRKLSPAAAALADALGRQAGGA
ncbi:LysR family transcriptional regulator [Streptomyces sp. CB01373]|uniref:LysR family transcriptional regulator n=1 Tax=Streptomyces sp. CB01373 TaxID=2020325 RepID=UPI000C26FDA7|nr:LysR family transcriptional regulator [Streptomyces sp. CB01373]PJM93143.1 LysR family transcriptional regulator [Streptomyces sp. CB01373]